MIDPATGWFEIKEIKDKYPHTIAHVVETTWLTRYPWPTKIIHDRGNEFLTDFAKMVKDDYGIKNTPTTKRNPQANEILERLHQTLGNILRTFQLYAADLNENETFEGVLAAAMFALRATYHTTTQATPSQLVFGRDAILNVRFEADWNYIRQRKQEIIRKNNERENKSRKSHSYHVGDKVLYYRRDDKAKFESDPWEGPYTILQVNTNGTVRLEMGAITDTINIRLIKPYRSDSET